MDFERLYKCSNNEGSNSDYLNSILKALDFLFLFYDVFFFSVCFDTSTYNNFRHCKSIYRMLQNYINKLLPANPNFNDVPELYDNIRNLFLYNFPDSHVHSIQNLENKLKDFNIQLKSFYNANVKWWDPSQPETFWQYTLQRKYNSI